jgi:hypothetical protein
LKAAARGDQHFMFRRVVTPLLTVAALVGVDATAEAKVFRGKTSQGRAASVVVGSDGLLRTARVNWRGRCRQGGRFATKTAFLRPHDQSTADAFYDRGTYRLRQAGGYRLRITGTVRGTRSFDAANPAAERWSGRFRARVLVTRRGRYVDTCRIRNVRWSARLDP